jgi:hypothetical protein
MRGKMKDKSQDTNTLERLAKLSLLSRLTRLARLSFVACTNLKRRRLCVICGAIKVFSITNGAFHATFRHKNDLILKISETRTMNGDNTL